MYSLQIRWPGAEDIQTKWIHNLRSFTIAKMAAARESLDLRQYHLEPEIRIYEVSEGRILRDAEFSTELIEVNRSETYT